MTEDDKVLVLSVASLIDVQSIDGGDTLAMRFSKAGGQELVMLVPHQVTSALQIRVSEVLAQVHNFGHLKS